MKYFSLLLLFSFACFSQEPDADFDITNCQPIKGNYLWAAETELTNFQYLEFLWHVKKNIPGKYEEMLPDTTVWRTKMSYCEPYVDYYLRHPAYRNYPLVGVTKQQAETFCDWLEDILNDKFRQDPKHPVQTVDVRLPTDKEWQHAAKGGNPFAVFPWEGVRMRHTEGKHRGQIRANFVRGQGDYMGVAGNLNDGADITAPAISYWPNNYGLYNMSGNVAEMLQEEGKTRGGSWKSRAAYLEIDGEDEFEGITEPDCRIGFRYFVEIIEFKELDPPKKEELKAKDIEKMLISTEDSDSLMISKYEVTNRLYNHFLGETQSPEHQRMSKLWSEFIPYSKHLENNYATHSKYQDHPVVNISRESAEAFCEWLTQKYHTLKGAKYENIVFQLPTEEQWEHFAKGGEMHFEYPWGGPYVQNAKGEYLCNFNPLQERWIIDTEMNYLKPGIEKEEIYNAAAMDGFYLSCPVNSYNSNSIGGYCFSGNVAEMVANKEIIKGGSWGSYEFDLMIQKSRNYEGPSPFVGFRFMAMLLNKV